VAGRTLDNQPQGVYTGGTTEHSPSPNGATRRECRMPDDTRPGSVRVARDHDSVGWRARDECPVCQK
jgi:hypothetical protein